MGLWLSTPAIDHARITAAIGAAEAGTSGEIRVLVSHSRVGDAVAAAKLHFEQLGMTRTKHRNGVLIFLAPQSRKFAVIGDTAVHEKCGDAFWRLLAAAMSVHFQRGDFTGGLEHGIERAGALLAEQFPREPGDTNQLSNEVEETD